MQVIDIKGNRFGRLIVENRAFPKGKSGCRAYWHVLCDCGTRKIVLGASLRNGRTQSCGCLQRERVSKRDKRGDKNPCWKGGRLKNPADYIRLRQSDHPNATKCGYVLEHIAVMAEIIGRPLLPEETVHHKNGVRDDNRPKNLELWANSHPSGQRVEDLIAWAKEIFERYT